MSTKARAGLRQGPRLAALGASLCLLACSGTESHANDAASGGSSPGAGGVVANSGSGGSTPAGGAALGGSGTGGSASGGAAPFGGTTPGGGVSTSGGSASGGGSGASAAVSGAAGGFSFGGTAESAAGGRGGAVSGGSGASSDGGRGGSLGAGGANAGSTSGGAASGGSGGSGGASSSCPYRGSISYTLMRAASPTAAQSAAYDKITAALDKALGYYNCYTDITKQLRASYEPSVATADGNVNGSIRFGSQDSMNYITAMHEIGHTVGVGSNEWGRMIRDGIFTGATATAKLREIDGDPDAQVHGDAQHFWPYGLNYTNEVKSDADLLAHCALVMAIRADLYP